MEINLSQNIKNIISLLLLILLPLLLVLVGITTNFLNAWYYILNITWFAMGVIFYSSIN